MPCLKITAAGAVTIDERPPLVAGQLEFDGRCTVVTCLAPFLPDTGVWVGVLDDFGAAASPINRKAWGIYGRSHLYGTMFLGPDDEGPIPPYLIALLTKPIEEWPIDQRVIDLLTGPEPERPAMFDFKITEL